MNWHKKSIAGMLLAQFKDVMILILLAAAFIAGIVGDLTDTIVILLIVLLYAVFYFFQEYLIGVFIYLILIN